MYVKRVGQSAGGSFPSERRISMDARLEKYLDRVDRYLKPLPPSERIDIVKEIKGSILEMENEGFSVEDILERLGNPKEMARAYLGDLLTGKRGFSWNRLLLVCAFYGLAGFSGMIVIPVLGIIAPTFIFCGAVVPVAGLVKYVGALFGYDLPYVIFQLGDYTMSPALGLLWSVVAGAVLLFLGKGAWELLLRYIKVVSRTKRNLSV